MTQVLPPANSKGVRKNRNILIAVFVIGLVLIGLGVGTILNSPKGGNGLVLVSGTVQNVSFGPIQFINWNESESTRSRSAQLWFGKYEILLPGGHNYDVYYGFVKTSVSYHFKVYVPMNVTEFTANFDPAQGGSTFP